MFRFSLLPTPVCVYTYIIINIMLYVLYIHIYIYTCKCTDAIVFVWRSEDNLHNLVFSFYHWIWWQVSFTHWATSSPPKPFINAYDQMNLCRLIYSSINNKIKTTFFSRLNNKHRGLYRAGISLVPWTSDFYRASRGVSWVVIPYWKPRGWSCGICSTTC